MCNGTFWPLLKKISVFQGGIAGPSHDHKDVHSRRLEREKKIGHRRVNQQTGQVTYKKVRDCTFTIILMQYRHIKLKGNCL